MRMPFANKFRRMAANATGLVGTRLTLLSQELQEELARLSGRLAMLLALFACAAFALLFASAALLMFAWQHGYFIAAAIGLSLVCLIGAGLCAFRLREAVRTAPPPFAGTLAEFKRDEESLRNEDEAHPERLQP